MIHIRNKYNKINIYEIIASNNINHNNQIIFQIFIYKSILISIEQLKSIT